MTSFAQTSDMIESLPMDEQEDVLAVLQRRLAEHRRDELIATVNNRGRNLPAAKASPPPLPPSCVRSRRELSKPRTSPFTNFKSPPL
jgi:hypothetical protein